MCCNYDSDLMAISVCVFSAEKLFAAEKEGKRIAVKVKSFLSPSPMKDLEQALGQ